MDQTAELLSTWIESARDYAIILLDQEGLVSSWNVGATRILGYVEEEVVGQPLEIFFTTEDRSRGVPEKEIAEARASGRASDDRWHVRKDGSRFWCSGVLTRVQDEAGTLAGFVKVMRDLTERKLMEERLRARTEELVADDRRRNEFLAMLSHELRNPLAPILTGVYLLRKELPPENVAAHETRDMIERQTLHLKRIVDDLLDVARLSTSRIELRIATVDLAEVTRRAIAGTKPLLDERRHRLSLAADPGPLVIPADPVRVEQAISALLSNAAKFTEPGGTIEVAVRREVDQAVVRVRDSGIGMDPETLSRAFEMFEQGDQGLARSPGGLGIGLTLARRLIQLHGGTVDARSDGPGKGCEVVIKLPATSQYTQPADEAGDRGTRGRAVPLDRNGTKPAPSEVASGSGRGLRVLLVDDNRDAARSSEMLLRQAGHDILIAHDGAEAIAIAGRHHADVVLLDVGLPFIDGYGVARELRRNSTIPIIAVTGYAPEQATSLLFNAYLVKPVHPEELVSVLDRIRPAAPASKAGSIG